MIGESVVCGMALDYIREPLPPSATDAIVTAGVFLFVTSSASNLSVSILGCNWG